jgi:epoxyqueuosine reductase
MNSNDIKQEAFKLGARLCGIASVNRFIDAPIGFGPLDLFPKTQSAIAFAKQIPKGSLDLPTNIPYTVIENISLHETHRIAWEIVLFVEAHGYNAVIVPSEPYEYWDAVNKTGKGLVSLKHIAYQCGLGAWGKNKLLYNPQIGNLMRIGAVLTDAVLESDSIIETQICKPNCRLCISSCPSGALSAKGMEQLKCREYGQTNTPKGDPVYSCNVCRKVCPNVFGFAYNGNSIISV